jgi:mannose-6-phosphate isomerase-like protein (cupin superfamily)
VVTGDDADGMARFVQDDEVAPVRVAYFPATEFHRLWGGDEVPTAPGRGAPPPPLTYFPAESGCRFGLVTFPPAGTVRPADLDVSAALEEVERELPGLMGHRESDAGENAGMHTTPTVDFEVVLSGEITLELDDGAVRTLRPFDTVVQNGTRHRWRNLGGEPAVMAVFMVGARPVGAHPIDPSGESHG